MATRLANTPFDIDDYLRRLGLDQPADGASAPGEDISYDPYRTTSTSPTGGTSDAFDWSSRESGRAKPQPQSRPGPPNDWDTTVYDPPDAGGAPAPQVKQPQECPRGYEWEDGGPDFPNGRCKIIGMTWEESQGKVAPGWERPPDAKAPSVNAGGGSGGSSGARIPTTNYAFDLQALLKMLGPQYDALVSKIRAGTNPYDPSTIEALVGNRKVAAERQKLDQRRLLQAQRSAAGMGTQGMTQQDIRSQAAGADIASASDINQIRESAIKANYAAQIGRIDQEINALNSHANFVMGLASSDTARQSAQLQYASQLNALQAQKQNLELQLQAQLDQLKLQLLFR